MKYIPMPLLLNVINFMRIKYKSHCFLEFYPVLQSLLPRTKHYIIRKMATFLKVFALALYSCTVLVQAGRYNGLTNQAGLNLIKEFEGFRANFYNDPVGIRTIGYGHACHVWNCNVPLNGKYSVPLSRSNAEKLLKADLSGFENCVRNAITYNDLNANQFSALVSFSFNLGCGSLRSSTLRTLLNNGNVSGASREFRRWVNAGGRRLPGLVRRREAERRLFCMGGRC